MDTISHDCRLRQFRAPKLNHIAGILGNHYAVLAFNWVLNVDSLFA